MDETMNELINKHHEIVRRILFYIENHIDKVRLDKWLIENNDIFSLICGQGHMKDFIILCEKYIESSDKIIDKFNEPEEEVIPITECKVCNSKLSQVFTKQDDYVNVVLIAHECYYCGAKAISYYDNFKNKYIKSGWVG